MYIFLWISAILVASFIIIMFTSIIMEVQILKNKTNDEIILHIKALFGLVQYKFEIPLLDLIQKQDGKLSLEVDEEIESEKSQDLIQEKKQLFSLSQIQEIQDRASQLFNQYFNVVNYIRKKLLLSKLEWETEFGTGDAAVTGMLCGVLWGIKGNLFAILKRHVHSNNISFNIIPYFDKELFKTYVHCIIRLKIGHAIIASIKTAYLYLKRGDKQNVKSSN
ncbi:hypothetical protein HNQ80_002766 [Anaerosolibacter carboniphilus]|uniref:DUF2953 domain-containing protein n=2 Tax=Anaerosolibacter carboniphilus TaxID=1417629 RepID=A0A841L0G4_9FIRM|nr:hypothetical protein [Anaerosolibacter carboniphilus]